VESCEAEQADGKKEKHLKTRKYNIKKKMRK
jgi:hypothetical protein